MNTAYYVLRSKSHSELVAPVGVLPKGISGEASEKAYLWKNTLSATPEALTDRAFFLRNTQYGVIYGKEAREYPPT